MVRIKYNNSISDYIKLQFTCICGYTINTELIPVKMRYDTNMNVNSFSHVIVCKNCKHRHVLQFYDNMYESYCEIPSLNKNDDIGFIHEIPYEYAYESTNSLSEYVSEIGRLNSFVDSIDRMDISDKSTLYKMALVYSIAIMDAFLGNTFRHYVLNFEVFKNKFLSYKAKNGKSSPKDIINKLRNQSFQNLDFVAIPYYKEILGIKIPKNKKIQDSLKVRNTFIHNSGKEKDGYEYVVDKIMVAQLIKEIKYLITIINCNMLDVLFEEIIRK